MLALNWRQHVFDVEIVFEGQVEEGVEPVLAPLAGDVGDSAAFVMLQFRLVHFMHGDARPVAAEPGRALELLAEMVAEGGVGIDRTLRLLRFVVEDALPRR